MHFLSTTSTVRSRLTGKVWSTFDGGCKWAHGPLDDNAYRDFARTQPENFVNDVEWRYFVVDRRGVHFVGGDNIDLVNSAGVQSANIGYWTCTLCTIRQFATRTAGLLTDDALNDGPEISHVEIVMDVANVASARTPSKLR